MVRGLINHLFHTNVNDIMTGYRAFSRTFVKTFPVLSQGFEIETEMTIHAVDKNFLIREVPVSYRDRPEGSVSKLNTYSDGSKVLCTIARLYKNYHPFAFFSILAGIIFVISFLFFLPVLGEYLVTGLVPRMPTLLACAIGLVVSLLLLMAGLILSTMQQKDKRDFEMQLIQVCRQKNAL